MRPKVERSEKDGLVVMIDDETDTLTFEWDDETHPQWNFLRELGEERVAEMLMDYCKQAIFEHELKDHSD
jgi:hypothetical protein